MPWRTLHKVLDVIDELRGCLPALQRIAQIRKCFQGVLRRAAPFEFAKDRTGELPCFLGCRDVPKQRLHDVEADGCGAASHAEVGEVGARLPEQRQPALAVLMEGNEVREVPAHAYHLTAHAEFRERGEGSTECVARRRAMSEMHFG